MLIREREGRCFDAIQRESHQVELGVSAAHDVGVYDGQSQSHAQRQGDDRIDAADLKGKQPVEAALEETV